MVFNYILIFFPFAVIVLCMTLNLLTNINKKLLNKVFYFINLIWMVVFVIHYKDYIISARILRDYHTWNKEVYNIAFTIITLIGSFKFLEYTFFKSINIKKISFKGMEIDVADVEEFKKLESMGQERYKAAANAIKVQNRLIADMSKYIKSQELEPSILYEKLMKKYGNLRKGVKVNCFDFNGSGIDKMSKYYAIDIERVTSMMCVLKDYGVYLCEHGKLKKMFVLVDTKFTPDDLIVVLEGNETIVGEQLIILNIIDILDLYLRLEVEEIEI